MAYDASEIEKRIKDRLKGRGMGGGKLWVDYDRKVTKVRLYGDFVVVPKHWIPVGGNKRIPAVCPGKGCRIHKLVEKLGGYKDYEQTAKSMWASDNFVFNCWWLDEPKDKNGDLIWKVCELSWSAMSQVVDKAAEKGIDYLDPKKGHILGIEKISVRTKGGRTRNQYAIRFSKGPKPIPRELLDLELNDIAPLYPPFGDEIWQQVRSIYRPKLLKLEGDVSTKEEGDNYDEDEYGEDEDDTDDAGDAVIEDDDIPF